MCRKKKTKQKKPHSAALTCGAFCNLISNNWNNRGSEHGGGLSDDERVREQENLVTKEKVQKKFIRNRLH